MDISVSEISLLTTGTPDEKRALLSRLLSTRSPGGVELAIDALGDRDWTIRRFAAERLAGLGPPVLERLGKVLSTGDENQRYWAVRALVGIGREATPLLLRLLARGAKPMRTHAAVAMGEIGDPAAIPALVEALGDEVWQVRFHAFEGLVAFGEGAFPALSAALEGENEDRSYWAAKALGKLGERSRDVLLQALRNGNRRLRFVVAAALGETGDLRVVKVLVGYLSDKSWIVRKRASDALAEIGPIAIPTLMEALAMPEGPATRWLLAALCRMGEKGVKALVLFLRKRGEAFAWNAKDDLTGLGPAAEPVFLELIGDPDRDLRFFAATCLGELPSDAKIDEALLRCLADPTWSIRKVAADALAERGPAVLGRLSQAMDTGNEDLRFWVTAVFRKMGSAGVEKLLEALQDSNSNVAYFAATALAEVPEKRVVKPLIRALASSSWPVRNAASTSLALLADLAVESLVNAVEDEHEDVAFWVVKTLRRIGRKALPDMVRMLKKGTDEQRLHAAKALGAMRDPEAVEPLIAALLDGHEWVRLYACLALGEIGDQRSSRALIGVVRDPAFKIHPKMVGVFKAMGPGVVPDLLEIAAHGEPGARANALFVLGSMRVEAALETLRKAALDESEPHEVRVAAVTALGSYQEHGEAVVTLAGVVEAQATGPIRSRALLALGEIDRDDALPVLLRGMAMSETREDVARVVNMLTSKGPRILPNLIEALGHRDVAVRKAGAEILERMGGAAVPYLKTAAGEGDQNVRFWAQKLLKKGTPSGPGPGLEA